MELPEHTGSTGSNTMKPVSPTTSAARKPLSTEGTSGEKLVGENEGATRQSNSQKFSKFELTVLSIGLLLGVFIGALDTTVLAIAVPKITSEFNSLDEVGWYGAAYMLTQAAFQPSCGKIYNNFDLKWTFLCALIIFQAGSVLCAAAKSSKMLIAGRAVGGMGFSALVGGLWNIVSTIVPIEKRPLCFAVVSSMMAIASVAGPVLGGVLTERLGWRWCFWINVPPCGVVFIFMLIFLKRNMYPYPPITLRERFMSLDPLGGFVLLCGTTAFILATTMGGSKYPWSNPDIWGCWLAFAIAAIIFCVIQWRLGDMASIPPRLLKQRTIWSASLVSFFLTLGSFPLVYFLPIYLQAVKGSSPEKSGLELIPYQLSNTLASVASGLLIGLVGWYAPFAWLGSAVFVIGSGLLFTIRADSKTSVLIGYQICVGVGIGSSIQIPYTAAQVVVDKTDMPTANSLMLFFHSLGSTAALPIAQSIFLSTLYQTVPEKAPHIKIARLIEIGPTKIRGEVPPDQLAGVLEAYSGSLTEAFLLSVAAGSVGFLSSLFFEWRSVKRRG